MAALPSSQGASTDSALAQYLVTKVTWWGSYRRIIVVTASSVLTYNPETFRCTNQWDLAEIEDLEVAVERDQFILRLEKSRFRWAKVRFQCHARSHFLSLIHKLRRQFTFQPLRFWLSDTKRPPYYHCTEHFGDDSYVSCLLQVTVSDITFMDDQGRVMSSLPFMYLHKVAISTAHPDGIVLSTLYHERLLLCQPRNQCLTDIVTAAHAVGVKLTVEQSPLDRQLLRLRNTQLLDRPSIACFDVRSPIGDGKNLMDMQVVLQGEGIVEVHPAMRTVILREYAALISIVRSDWNAKTVVLEFLQGDTLVLKIDGRDQFIALLLLVCREAGHDHITLTSTETKSNRCYHPNIREHANVSAGAVMEVFFLRRLLKTHLRMEESFRSDRSSMSLRMRHQQKDSSWFQRHLKDRKTKKERSFQSRHSLDSGVSMNENVGIKVAMEELNANIPLAELSYRCHKELLIRAIKLLAEHLCSLVVTMRTFGEDTHLEVITTLQALVRLCHAPHAFFTDQMIPRVFDALHDLFLQQEFLTCYWCLKLIQCFFVVMRVEWTRGQRAKVLEYFVKNTRFLSAIVDLLPSSSGKSSVSSGYWMHNPEISDQTSELSSKDSVYSWLQSKEARLETDMNIVFHEVLFTIHHVLIYLRGIEQQQLQSCVKVQTMENVDIPNRSSQRRRSSPVLVQDNDDIPATKQKHELAGKLLEKYQFLVDSIADIRLVRATQAPIALMEFLINEFTGNDDTPGKLKRRSSTSRCSYGNEADKDKQRPLMHCKSSILPSNIGKYDAAMANMDFHQIRAHKLVTMQNFLESYHNQVATLDRSQLFPAQKTIIAPVWNRNGSSVSTELNIEVSDKAQHESYLKLEDLAFTMEDTSSDSDRDDGAVQPVSYRRSMEDVHNFEAMDRSRVNKFSRRSKSSKSMRHSRSLSPRSGRNLRAQASATTRATARNCDACIGCNDVCGNSRCFFCAEKQYHLESTFYTARSGMSASEIAPTLRHADHNDPAASSESSFNGDRNYSSCEVRRHQSKQSCWIIVDGGVFDVTDFLTEHPGGMQLILQAARNGNDCGPLMDKHPLAARQILSQYFIGEYYQCEKRTLLP